jgi:hypothetical protein
MSRRCLIATGCAGSGAALALAYIHLQQDRWVKVRRHPWASVRYIYQSFKIYQLAWRLDRAYSLLPVAVDAQEVLEGGDEVLDKIFAEGPETFQEKPSNRKQIESLMDCVCGLVQSMRETGATPLLLDMGAGKALFSRALYEALDRKVAVVAMDIRGRKSGDHFYDPPPVSETNSKKDNDEKPFTRIVANVHRLVSRTIDPPLHEGKNGGVICITKHLCGGATDGSIKALCASPLEDFVGACCLAPCCHQKTLKEQYCNPAFLESQGLCRTHIGLRGGVEDPDFRTFGMLISMSKSHDLKEWEYKKSALLKLLGPSRAQQLGYKARRILEEGRIRYLRANGFEAHLVRYCDSSVTFDNLAIIATRYSSRTPE